MTNPPIPPIVPRGDDDEGDTVDRVEFFDDDDDAPLDPELDADQVDSAEADTRAATEGTKDSGVDR